MGAGTDASSPVWVGERKGAGRRRGRVLSSPIKIGEPPSSPYSPAAIRRSPGSPGLLSTVRKGGPPSILLSPTSGTQVGTRGWGTETEPLGG